MLRPLIEFFCYVTFVDEDADSILANFDVLPCAVDVELVLQKNQNKRAWRIRSWASSRLENLKRNVEP